MKRIIMTFALALMMILSSANAVTVDGNTTLATLNNTFNYTFSGTYNFDVVGVYDDRVQLDYINISFVPASSTGNATVTLWNSTHKQMSICGNNQNIKVAFWNVSSPDIIINVGATKYSYTTDGVNLTFTGVPACTTIVLIEPRGAQYWSAGSKTVIVNDATCAGDTVTASYQYEGDGYLSGSLSRLIITFIVPIGLIAVVGMAAWWGA